MAVRVFQRAALKREADTRLDVGGGALDTTGKRETKDRRRYTNP